MKKLYILPLIALGMTACVDDEGNYTYTDLNEVTVDNLEANYNVLSKVDHLKISPDISDLFGQDLSQFSFRWQICSGQFSSGGYHIHTVIGEEKDLDWLVDLEPGSYALYFIVKDNNTGLEKQSLTNITVTHPNTRGFLILGELADEHRVAVDLLSMPSGLDTIMMENVFDNSQLNLQSPDKLIYSGYHYNGHTSHAQTLYLLADEKSYRLDTGSSFDLIGEFNDLDLFDTDYPIKRPAKMIDMFPHQAANRNMSGSYRGYMTEDMVVVAGITAPPEYFHMPVNRYSSAATTLFKPAPYAFYNVTNTYTPMMFYDMDEKKFAHIYPLLSSSYTCSEAADTPSDPWSWKTGEEGREMIYGENPRGNVNQSYAIMKDASDQYFIYGFKVQSYAYTNASKTLYPVNLSVAVDFDKASTYMFSSSRTSVFYYVGSRLYQYDYSRNYIGYLDFDDEITYLEQDYCSNGYPNQFFVATYSDANKGKIYKLEFSTNPDGVDFSFLDNQEWSTRLKVKDLEWKYGV